VSINEFNGFFILQEQFRLDETANEEHAKRVFHNAARKVINGSMSDARVKDVTVYFKKVKGQRMTNKQPSGTTMGDATCV
jgi:hypothetical protein